MNLRAQVALNLPSQENKVVLEYSTYEEARWDQYFIATLVNNTNSKAEGLVYLENLTRKGSLNTYFKKLLDDVIANKEKSPEVFQRLLESSLYPVINLDDSYRWFYLSTFKMSLLRKNKKDVALFPGKLSDDKDEKILNEQIFENLLRKNETFISVKNYLLDDVLVMHNLYDVELQDNQVLVKFLDEWLPLTLLTFNEVLQSEAIDLDNFAGKLVDSPTKEGWKILHNKDLQDFLKERHFYDEDDENLYLIQDNGLVLIEIYQYSEDLYLYRRTFKNYDYENATKTVNFLLASKAINEFKTKPLLSLLDLINPTLAKEVVDRILINKDSKELAEFGFKLIRGGFDDWNSTVLKKIKVAAPVNELQIIYKIDPSIFDFENESSLIMGFPDDILSQEHQKDKEAYRNDHQMLLNEIIRIIGEITASGIREEMKILKANETTKRLKKSLNSLVGHNKGMYQKMDLKTLKKEYRTINYVYTTDYPRVLKMIENEKSKSKNQTKKGK